jgi:GNAT superfamily N-acetyltransferase
MIRAATIEDGVPVVVMTHDFYQVSGYAGVIPFDAQSCYERFLSALEQGMCFVADKAGELIGFVLGVTAPCIFNKHHNMGVELAWWVKPEHRNTSAGIKLLKAIEGAAKDSGVVLWSMVCLESQAPETVEGIYLKLGYHKTERTFSKVL